MPHATLAFFALAMAMISLWVKRTPWIWGAFLVFTFVLGYFAKLIAPVAIVPVGALLILHIFLSSEIQGAARFILFIITIAVSLGLLLNAFPGFRNWEVVQNVEISRGAYPYSLSLGFNKPFVGFFILAVTLPLIKSWGSFRDMLRVAAPLTIAGVFILALAATYMGIVRFDPKFPNLFWFFAIFNLLMVSVIEEAFLRGFIQRELYVWIGGRGVLANIASVGITSIAFAAMHYFWVPSFPFLGFIFLAAVIYGGIYQITKAIEASILCHWAFNVVHFLLFTYPALKPVIAT